MPCVFLLVRTINLLIGGVCWRTQIDKYIETHPNIQTAMKTYVNKHESLQKMKAASVIFSLCCKHISVFHICVYLCVCVCTSKPRLFWDELLPLPLKQLAGNRMRVIQISFFSRTNEVFFCLLVNQLTLYTSIRSVWRVGSWGGAEADVKHSGQLWLLFPAVRCSATLLAFLGHSIKFYVFFRDTCFSGALTECITFLLMGSSDGAKMQRRAPFGRTTSCYTTCYTEQYKIRQLQTGTETLWLVLPCETNSLVCKTTPSDHISQSVAHSQGSLS